MQILLSLFGLPETTDELCFFKLQIYGNIFPGCFLGTKMYIVSLKKLFRFINNDEYKSLFSLPETTEELSFFKLQICGNIFPRCFLGTKMYIVSL